MRQAWTTPWALAAVGCASDSEPLARTTASRHIDKYQWAEERTTVTAFTLFTWDGARLTELVDETGHIAWHSRTTLWGTTTFNRDATAYTPLRFPGQYADPETALHYNHHRHYDPDTARYTTPDPLGLTPAPNPLTYPHNPHNPHTPHTHTDPHGLAPCPNNVALGIRKRGLREFADSNEYTHYLDNWNDFESEVRAAARNPDVHLHVMIDGFDGDIENPAEQFMNAYRQGRGGNWYATEGEMYHVGKSVRLGDRTWDSTIFYRNGEVVRIPEPEN